ncbi:MAG: single-stranded DNA-binding protein [Fimbriimonadaceae bacterium]
MSLNRATLVGRLTHDPEIRDTTTGTKVVNFQIAVDRRFKSQDQDTDFFRIVAFGQTAEFVGNYLHKGRLVAVDGRLQMRKYTNREGQQREIVEIVADNVQGLDRARDQDGGGGYSQQESSGGPRSQPDPAPAEDEFDPFAEE